MFDFSRNDSLIAGPVIGIPSVTGSKMNAPFALRHESLIQNGSLTTLDYIYLMSDRMLLAYEDPYT